VAELPDILFYVFAFLTLVCGFLVVLNPFSTNPVTSAMFLVLTIASLAGLFVLLHAFFLAAVQILVYAGAVMVLFLFVIMLLDLPAEERRKVKKTGVVLGLISVGAILIISLQSLLPTGAGAVSPLTSEATPTLEGNTIELGKLLFTQYLLPFEIISVLLLVAMVGVILLSKRDLK
jgi:NADH-quinone oxidoreductase subunit J